MVLGGDLNGFRDIKPFMKLMGWGIPGHAPAEYWSVLIKASYHEKHE